MIDKYSFGKIIIDGKSYQSDVIVFGETVIDNWWRKKGHELCIADIQSAIERFKPSAVIVGTGKFGFMKVLPETISYLESLHISLIAQKTEQACNTFNQLINQQPLGAFHLTC